METIGRIWVLSFGSSCQETDGHHNLELKWATLNPKQLANLKIQILNPQPQTQDTVFPVLNPDPTSPKPASGLENVTVSGLLCRP